MGRGPAYVAYGTPCPRCTLAALHCSGMHCIVPAYGRPIPAGAAPQARRAGGRAGMRVIGHWPVAGLGACAHSVGQKNEGRLVRVRVLPGIAASRCAAPPFAKRQAAGLLPACVPHRAAAAQPEAVCVAGMYLTRQLKGVTGRRHVRRVVLSPFHDCPHYGPLNTGNCLFHVTIVEVHGSVACCAAAAACGLAGCGNSCQLCRRRCQCGHTCLACVVGFSGNALRHIASRPWSMRAHASTSTPTVTAAAGADAPLPPRTGQKKHATGPGHQAWGIVALHTPFHHVGVARRPTPTQHGSPRHCHCHCYARPKRRSLSACLLRPLCSAAPTTPQGQPARDPDPRSGRRPPLAAKHQRGGRGRCTCQHAREPRQLPRARWACC